MANSKKIEGHRLLTWFDRQARDLPWRQSKDPYRIWVSEIMLQQTQVKTVIPYFHRFIERFPDVEALASSELDDVLVLWSGLGYYRRARQLHAAAIRVVDSGGKLPRTSTELQNLPGIGPYTAAAIASIAFNECIPVLDGNVERVISRYLALAKDPKRRSGRDEVRKTADELLDLERPGDSNQALMEVGATVCTPRSPLCEDCPLGGGCKARLEGEPERYPILRPRRVREKQVRHVIVAQLDKTTLLYRRSAESEVLAGTWELPWVSDAGNGNPMGASAVEEALASKYGLSWRVGPAVAIARHAITFRDIELQIRRGTVEGLAPESSGREMPFAYSRDVTELPTSSQVGKVLKALDKREGKRGG